MPTAALNLCAGSAGVACDVPMGTAGGTRVGGEEGHARTGAVRAWACAALSEAGQARTSSGAARGNPPPAHREMPRAVPKIRIIRRIGTYPN